MDVNKQCKPGSYRGRNNTLFFKLGPYIFKSQNYAPKWLHNLHSIMFGFPRFQVLNFWIFETFLQTNTKQNLLTSFPHSFISKQSNFVNSHRHGEYQRLAVKFSRETELEGVVIKSADHSTNKHYNPISNSLFVTYSRKASFVQQLLKEGTLIKTF